MDCIFCKMAKGEIPTEKVYETDSVFAIKDINPQAPTHLLLIPKTHYKTLMEIEDKEVLGEVLASVKEIAKKLGFAESGFRTVINTGKGGGQIVFHLHVHILSGKEMSEEMA
ncbi:MAG: histidine triad nucleotide-binding protein [Deltaproteobacteria bacterium]|nr:histidine triad nucleotide-binding protein [Deltaproteobacteria bacterium]